jgi:hypothetical protein
MSWTFSFLSKRATERPFSAAVLAAVSPAGPAPIMTRSKSPFTSISFIKNKPQRTQRKGNKNSFNY